MTVDTSGNVQENALDTLLATYARGGLSAPMHALVASHLAIRPENRSFVATLEEAGASELLNAPVIPLERRDERLARIFESPLEETPSPAVRKFHDPVLPHPLARYLGRGLADVPWRTLLPGVKEFRVEDNEDGEATLYWIRAGRKMPSHTHEGSEFTLVLKGAFSDMNGHYGRGDIAIADMDVDHRPIADEGEDCFCFAVTDAPLRLTGPIGRIVQRLFKG